MRILLLAFGLLCAITTNALSQGLPNPKPSEEHKVLAKEVGTWDCEIRSYFQGPEQPPTVTKGVETNKLVSGDMYLQTTFTGEIGGRQFEGHSLLGYDPHKKKYVGTWADNFTVAPSQVTGTYDKELNTFTALSSVYDEQSKQELKQKQVTKWEGENKKVFTIYLLLEIGGETSEIKLMDMTAVRRD